jgi:pilus assembly protein Flp/PilA
MTHIKRFAADESGATAIEYSLCMTLLSAIIIVALGTFAEEMQTMFTKVTNALKATPK